MTPTNAPSSAPPPHDVGGLGPILAPRSIAVIGASRRADTMGHQILRNLLTYGYTGAAYP